MARAAASSGSRGAGACTGREAGVVTRQRWRVHRAGGMRGNRAAMARAPAPDWCVRDLRAVACLMVDGASITRQDRSWPILLKNSEVAVMLFC